MIAAGASAGVSAAFGAPIGGALFSYEMSKPNTFWTFSMLWRVFAASSLSTFALSIFSSMWGGRSPSLTDSATLKFGKLADNESSMMDLPASIVIGIVCGLLGALFIGVNISLAVYRKKNIKKNWMKIVEACLFAFLTATCFFFAVVWLDEECYPTSQLSYADESVRFRCKEG